MTPETSNAVPSCATRRRGANRKGGISSSTFDLAYQSLGPASGSKEEIDMNVQWRRLLIMIFNVCIVLATLYLSWQTYHGFIATRRTIGSWGCEMSWMTPSYSLVPFQPESRYRLYLYREQGWDADDARGRPILFIPGNAGSYQQVRSIASLAARTAAGSLDFYTGKSTTCPSDPSRSKRRVFCLFWTYTRHASSIRPASDTKAVQYTRETRHAHRPLDGRNRRAPGCR